VNLDFLTLTAGNGAVARSPMERLARAAGARFEVRDGWNVAVEYPSRNVTGEVAWADVSHLPKLELQGTRKAVDSVVGNPLQFGTAVRHEDAWWCPLSEYRTLVIGARPKIDSSDLYVADVTSNFAAITITGPLARETFARFCALDLRSHVTPVGALRPGSIGRQPGILIREDEDRYLFLFGWATGEYMWSTVADAAAHLGGGPIGVDALVGTTAEAVRA
jgi:glycine cleavage system aminomethyltransferase T